MQDVKRASNKKNNLSHTQKMILVPYDEYREPDGHSDESNITSHQGILRDLNVRMRNALRDRSLSDQKKIFVYNQLLRKYLFIKDELKKSKKDDLNKLLNVLRPSSLEAAQTPIIKKKIISRIPERSHPLTQSLFRPLKKIEEDNDSDLDEELENVQAPSSTIEPDRGDYEVHDESMMENTTPPPFYGSSTPVQSSAAELLSTPQKTSSLSHSYGRSVRRLRESVKYPTKPYYLTRAQLKNIREEVDENDDNTYNIRHKRGQGISTWLHLN